MNHSLLLSACVLLSTILIAFTNTANAYLGLNDCRILHTKKYVNTVIPNCKQSGRCNGASDSLVLLSQNKGRTSEASGADLKTKIKNLLAEYGVLAVGIYFSIYVLTLSTIFFLVDNGYIGTFGIDPASALKKIIDTIEGLLGFVQFPLGMKENPKVATVAVAWLMTKFTEPLRVIITVGIVPQIAQFFMTKKQ